MNERVPRVFQFVALPFQEYCHTTFLFPVSSVTAMALEYSFAERFFQVTLGGLPMLDVDETDADLII